jgi:hypothetical protein
LNEIQNINNILFMTKSFLQSINKIRGV